MPWKYESDSAADELHRVAVMAGDIEKRSNAIHAAATERLAVIHKHLAGAQGGALAPDLVKAADSCPLPPAVPLNPMTPRNYSSSMNADLAKALTTSYPDDVLPAEQIRAKREVLQAELAKAPDPDAPVGFLRDARSAWVESDAEVATFAASRGMYPPSLDLTKAAADFEGGASKKEGNIIRRVPKRETGTFQDGEDIRESAILLDLTQSLKKSGNLDDLDYTLDLSLEAGTFTTPRILEGLSKIPGLSPGVRQKAREAADKARRQQANEAGRPYVAKGSFE